MKTNIFIPEKINVGFQNRSDTYTKKLAYVIYFDHKSVLRKEASWNSWRDRSIDNIIYENAPTSGFVLNKKVGDYVSSWNHRQAYVRVYDPRGFEFEITITNLLYILENTNSIKGKGLEGDFVYGIDGKELILIPTGSPDYVEITQFNKILHEKTYIKSRELILGATYKTKDNQEWTYMGRFNYYDYDVNKGKKYYFHDSTRTYSYFQTLKSLGDKLIGVVSEDCADNYADLFDKLERTTNYSPYDETKDEYISYEYDSFLNKMSSDKYGYGASFYVEGYANDTIKVKRKRDNEELYNVSVGVQTSNRGYFTSYNYYEDKIISEGTLEDVFSNYKPMYKNKYLTNGKLYEKGE